MCRKFVQTFPSQLYLLYTLPAVLVDTEHTILSYTATSFSGPKLVKASRRILFAPAMRLANARHNQAWLWLFALLVSQSANATTRLEHFHKEREQVGF